MAVVFVSHASADEPFVRLFFDFLQTACDLRREDIFCTSIESAGIETGSDFVDWIGNNIRGADIAILVLSPNYFASGFCLAEMGAAWALDKRAFPIVLEGVTRDPGLVFMRHQSVRCDKEGLDNLRDAIATFHPKTAEATARWTVKRDEFLEAATAKMAALPDPALVPRDALEKEQERAAAAMDLYREANAANRELREKNERLAELKDRDQLAAVEADYSDVAERVEAGERAVRATMREFGRVELRGLYAAWAQEEWHPDRATWDYWTTDIEKAGKKGWLDSFETMGDERYYKANLDHPRYSETVERLNALEAVVSTIDEEERALLESQRGYLINTRNYEYWEEALVENPMLD